MPGKTLSARVKPVSRIGQRRQVVLPKEVLARLGLQTGDYIEFSTAAGRVSLRPKKRDADDVLSPAEGQKVRHALKQATTGKTRSWADVKNELGL